MPASSPAFTFVRRATTVPCSVKLSRNTCSTTRSSVSDRRERRFEAATGPRPTRARRACDPASLAQMPQEPHLRELPVAFDGLSRNIQDLGRLLDAEPTEEAQ